MFEHTIRNHEQNFLDNWYSKVKQFALSLMKNVVLVCNKTIDATAAEILSTTETSLKRNTKQEQFKATQSEIKNNVAAANMILQQRKVENSIF